MSAIASFLLKHRSLEGTDQKENLNFIHGYTHLSIFRTKLSFPFCAKEKGQQSSNLHRLTTVHFTFSLIHPVQNQKTYSSLVSFDLLKMKSLTIYHQKD